MCKHSQTYAAIVYVKQLLDLLAGFENRYSQTFTTIFKETRRDKE